MKKKRITYGVSGMMEFQTVLKVGKNRLKILFTDGSMSSMGVNPATFTTSDYMIQHIIEHSAEYKRGLIFRHSVTELEGEVRIGRPKPAAELSDTETEERVAAPVATENAEACAPGTPASAADAAAESGTIETVKAVEESTSGPETEGSLVEKTGEPRVEVEFSVNDDAKDYLEQNYGAVRSKLRTRNDILAFAESRNVDIKFV